MQREAEEGADAQRRGLGQQCGPPPGRDPRQVRHHNRRTAHPHLRAGALAQRELQLLQPRTGAFGAPQHLAQTVVGQHGDGDAVHVQRLGAHLRIDTDQPRTGAGGSQVPQHSSHVTVGTHPSHLQHAHPAAAPRRRGALHQRTV